MRRKNERPRSGRVFRLNDTLAAKAAALAVLGLFAGMICTPATGAVNDPGTWTTTGSLSTNRTRFTTTLLKNGKVLAVGGVAADEVRQADSALASVELYDPETGKWSGTRDLTTARYAHSATLLNSGKVLVVGGLGRGADKKPATLDSAEVYDPGTGKWATTKSLATGRYLHSATLLESGKVLVAGGANLVGADLKPLPDAEVYDPETGTWSVMPMPIARYGHTATRLADRKVLLVGGYRKGPGSLVQTSLYDATNSKWTMASGSGGRRVHHSAALLNSGRVLVIGGVTHPGGGGTAGSADAGGRTNAVELYNPKRDTWGVTGALPIVPQGQEAAALSDGNVLGVVVAGEAEQQALSAWLYNAREGTWGRAKSSKIEIKRSQPGFSGQAPKLTLLENGKMLVVAGYGEPSFLYTPTAAGRSGWPPAAALALPAIVGLVVLVILVRRKRQKRSRRRAKPVGGFAPR